MSGKYLFELSRRITRVETGGVSSGVHSLNGKTGTSIVLTTTEIPENTNLYMTSERVGERIDAIKGGPGGFVPLDGDGKVDVGIIVMGSIGTPISKTYSELDVMRTNGTLVVNQMYQLTDFQTIHTIQGTSEVNTGTTEVLILKAITTTEFAKEVTSITHPTDIIHYEFINTLESIPSKGRIIYRNDPIRVISMFYDWRSVIFRRWLDPSHNDKPILLMDTGGAYEDHLTFDFAYGVLHVVMGPVLDGIIGLNNVVFLKDATRVCMGDDAMNSTFCENVTDMYVGNTFTDNRMMCTVAEVVLGSAFVNNTCGDGTGTYEIRRCRFGESIENCVITANMRTMTMGSRINNITINCTNEFVSSAICDGFDRNIDAIRVIAMTMTSKYQKDIVSAEPTIAGLLYGTQMTRNTSPEDTRAITVGEYALFVNTEYAAGPTTYTLPPSADADVGEYYIITDRKGFAATKTITINPSGTDTIDGATTYVINQAFGALMVCNAGNGKWIKC